MSNAADTLRYFWRFTIAPNTQQREAAKSTQHSRSNVGTTVTVDASCVASARLVHVTCVKQCGRGEGGRREVATSGMIDTAARWYSPVTWRHIALTSTGRNDIRHRRRGNEANNSRVYNTRALCTSLPVGHSSRLN